MFRSNGGEPPQCGVTLCFGEELSNTEDPSVKLIIVQVSVKQPCRLRAMLVSWSVLLQHCLLSWQPR